MSGNGRRRVRSAEPRAHLRSGSARFPGVLASAGDVRIARANGGRAYLVQRRHGDEWATVSTAPTAGALGALLAILGAPIGLFVAMRKLPDDPREIDLARARSFRRSQAAARAAKGRSAPASPAPVAKRKRPCVQRGAASE